mmetsp:Transcript_8173/g.12935  ORF Transcript_8173/g.12935 Transcript_8173/m.12935 type:complete len:97 (+) Transcript_8173:449-739(+)
MSPVPGGAFHWKHRRRTGWLCCSGRGVLLSILSTGEWFTSGCAEAGGRSEAILTLAAQSALQVTQVSCGKSCCMNEEWRCGAGCRLGINPGFFNTC